MAPRMLCSFHYLWCFHSNEAGEVHTQTAGRLGQLKSGCMCVCVCEKVCRAVGGSLSSREQGLGTFALHSLRTASFYVYHQSDDMCQQILCKQLIFTEWLQWKPTLLVNFWDQIIPCRVEPCTIVPILRRKRKFVAVLLTHYTNSTGNYENLFLSWFVESINTMFLQNFPACVW